VIAKTPYALLSFIVGNHNLQERNKYHESVFTKYRFSFCKKLDEIEK